MIIQNIIEDKAKAFRENFPEGTETVVSLYRKANKANTHQPHSTLKNEKQ